MRHLCRDNYWRSYVTVLTDAWIRLSREGIIQPRSAQGLWSNQETHELFQSLIQSGLLAWAQGLVQPGRLMSSGFCFTVQVLSESELNEASWITFSDVSSSVEKKSVVES
ncbi:hypothetical protein Tco_0555853 [Tanacetum coccineum]